MTSAAWAPVRAPSNVDAPPKMFVAVDERVEPQKSERAGRAA
jgi:hypothetical protein